MTGRVKVSARKKMLVKNNQIFTKKENKLLTKLINALIVRLSQESAQNTKATAFRKQRNNPPALSEKLLIPNDVQLEGDQEITSNN